MTKIRAMLALLLLCALVSPLLCSAAPVPLSVSAKAAVLIDASDCSVLYEKNAHTKMGMASTTKIMTALVVAEEMPLDKVVAIPSAAVNTEGSSVYLCAGEQLSVRQLLYALLLASANDAAVALAICCSGSIEAFTEKMNEKAAKLGLSNTNFVNPHGLYDENHYTTAYDLARLSAAALQNAELCKIASTQKATIPQGVTNDCPEGSSVRYLSNHNKLLRSYEGAIGLKTGFTKKTGRCLVSAAERDGLRLVAVTLSAPDDWRDHTAMLDYGYSAYQHTALLKEGEFSYEFPLSGGVKQTLTLTNSEAVYMNLPRGQKPKVSYTVTSTHRFELAPIEKGRQIAELVVQVNGKSIKIPLVAAYTADKAE